MGSLTNSRELVTISNNGFFYYYSLDQKAMMMMKMMMMACRPVLTIVAQRTARVRYQATHSGANTPITMLPTTLNEPTVTNTAPRHLDCA